MIAPIPSSFDLHKYQQFSETNGAPTTAGTNLKSVKSLTNLYESKMGTSPQNASPPNSSSPFASAYAAAAAGSQNAAKSNGSFGPSSRSNNNIVNINQSPIDCNSIFNKYSSASNPSGGMSFMNSHQKPASTG